jgi:chlorobactene glucosyltransferase
MLMLYVAVGFGGWLALGWALTVGHRTMKLLHRPVREMRDRPRVTVLVPAKDEGERIGDCVRSILAQDYGNFSIIAINDRSTDETGRVLDQLARGDERLKVIHIHDGSLPAGWTGKCNALHTAVPEADGEWLLFVDSDVVLAPDALSATVERSVRLSYDMLSLLPKLESRTFWEGLLVPLAGMAVSVMYLVSLTNKDYLRKTAFGNGQYLFIRRRVYEEIGGHAGVRDRFCEDVEIARRVKRSGHKTRIAWGAEFAAVRMYSSLSGIFKGWGRNFYAGSLGRPWRILMAIGFVLCSTLSVVPALGWAAYRLAGEPPHLPWLGIGWALAAAGHLLLILLFLSTTYRNSGNPSRNAVLFPLGMVMLLGIFLKSLRMCITRKVEWRGTHYGHRMEQAAAR